jgi:hypothetical protein
MHTCNAITFAAAHGTSGTTRNGAIGVEGLDEGFSAGHSLFL